MHGTPQLLLLPPMAYADIFVATQASLPEAIPRVIRVHGQHLRVNSWTELAMVSGASAIIAAHFQGVHALSLASAPNHAMYRSGKGVDGSRLITVQT